MGEGSRSSRGDGGNVFVLLCILVLIVGIVSAAGMVMAVLNYNGESVAPVNINMDRSGSGHGGKGQYEPSYGGNEEDPYSNNRVHELHYDSKVWSIRVGDYGSRLAYIDRRTRQLRGYLIDIINAVCQLAGKNCEVLDADYLHCWNNDFPQVGLMGRWYDACAAYSVTDARLRSLKFTNAIKPAASPAIYTTLGNPHHINVHYLGHTKIGFLAGWWSNSDCVSRSLDIELTNNQVFVYSGIAALIAALHDGEVDAICASSELAPGTFGSLELVEELPPCLLRGESLMMRKDSLLDKWWNPAFEKLLQSRTYREICNDIDDPAVHGGIDGSSSDKMCLNI